MHTRIQYIELSNIMYNNCFYTNKSNNTHRAHFTDPSPII